MSDVLWTARWSHPSHLRYWKSITERIEEIKYVHARRKKQCKLENRVDGGRRQGFAVAHTFEAVYPTPDRLPKHSDTLLNPSPFSAHLHCSAYEPMPVSSALNSTDYAPPLLMRGSHSPALGTDNLLASHTCRTPIIGPRLVRCQTGLLARPEPLSHPKSRSPEAV